MATDDLRYVRVRFELPSCLWADRIYVVGDFNDWNATATPMHQDRDGVWRATVDLRRGSSYEFRYLIDGKWTSDTHADGFAPNHFGDSNSVVHASLPMPTLAHVDSRVIDDSVREILSFPTVRSRPSVRISRTTYPSIRRRASA
ncbi:MAG: isoamylase early set domain-containing protein [Caldilineaceae bacterium]|nr:isoamylase early set domain-containing protein [Caldilineaceae bacterium]